MSPVSTLLQRRAAFRERFRRVRRFSEALCAPLEPEDCVIQSMPDASPTRWHLAHTTWFFETFVLAKADAGFEPDADYAFLFNSYYNTVGRQFPRAQRGLLSRPTLAEVFACRREIDRQVAELLADEDRPGVAELLPLVELGLHHEQQHQELMLTDIKHVLSCNPLCPVYAPAAGRPPVGDDESGAWDWRTFDGGLVETGHDGDGFAFDNESPRHRVFLEPFLLADSLVTCGEYLRFIEDGGYQTPELWLSLGWQQRCDEDWRAPLYWRRQDGGWRQFTLSGLHGINPREPVCHVSYFEADAYARWAGARLPTEAEWELAAAEVPVDGNFVESGARHPRPAAAGDGLRQMFGDVWEWTASPYTAYPGYLPPEGAVGEYNGKFMCNQYVLRGGSCVTPQSHIRPTYRNFFPPDARWQFTGIRLAR